MIFYKVKGIILAVIISLASIMMPFSVYADTISNSNVHINYYMKSQTVTSSGSYRQIYQIDYVFDKEYVGWISSKVVYTYYTDNNLTQSQAEFTRAIYVNGGTASITYAISTTANLSSGAMVSMAQSIQNSNVVAYSDIETLQDILDILQDTYNYVSIDLYDELESILSATNLSNEYLETISKLRQWDFPKESLYPNLFMFYQGYELSDIFTLNYWSYPMFKIPSNSIIANPWLALNEYFYIIVIGYSFNNLSAVSQLLDTELVPISVKTLELYNLPNTDLRINLVQFQNQTSAGRKSIINRYTNNVMFVYYGSSDINGVLNVSTDFALQFGLSNRLLDMVNQIANGTTQSNSAASNLEDEASEYSEIADDVIDVEEGLTSNFETEVNKIDLDTGLNVFGGNFMTSATWVRTQFDRLTENTPYGSLVVYGLTLGFALLMLGKVFL